MQSTLICGRAILNQSNSKSDDTLPPFDEPWQAQSYAMAQVLIERGTISASAWADTFGAAIRARLASGAEDTTTTYFAAIADALATVLTLESSEIDQKVEDWREAFESTPHGKPVLLARDRT